MATQSSSKVYGTEHNSNARIATGVGEDWDVDTTADANEVEYVPDADCYQVEVINLDRYDSGDLTGKARVGVSAAGGSNITADGANYLTMAVGGSILIDVGDGKSIYYKRDAAVDVSILFRERKA